MNSNSRSIGRLLWLALLPMALTGCGLLRVPASRQNTEIKSLQIQNGASNRPVSLDQIQARVMRFADVYSVQVAEAADNFSAKVKTPEARLEALHWKLGQATSAYIDATGPNPALNVLDTLVLVTLSRMVMEDYGVKTYGNEAVPLLETHRRLETNAWSLARGIFSTAQQQELRDLIREWRQKNPDQRSVGAIRFQEFALALGRSPRPGTTIPTSIFSLLFLDPLAGLDPTTASMEETRLLGERAVYYTQRLPNLLAWQTELLTYQLANQPESKQVLSDAARLTASAESFSRTMEKFPALINDQRQAAIQQVLDAMNSQDAQLRELLAGARQTFNAGNEMADSVNRAIKSLDEFIDHTSASPTNGATNLANARPFDILEYGQVAGQIGAAADRINSALTSLKEDETQWERLNGEVSASADRVVQHAFWRGMVLILILLVGAVLAGLSYRILAAKLVSPKSESRTPESSKESTRDS